MKNLHPTSQFISREEKQLRLGQHAKVFWMTGLSGSGKSTLATALEKRLFELGYHTVVLDGDNIRTGINNNLSFSAEDRTENIRRIAEVAKLFISNGQICIVSFISPTIEMRNNAKQIIGENNFVEVFIDTPIEICESRDIKGLYKKARAGEISDFTGVNAPYEIPISPDIHIQTKNQSVDLSFSELYDRILPFIKW
ncbi:MAG: adenylyl-sulfate kinase [Saprospiraceae bacterium]